MRGKIAITGAAGKKSGGAFTEQLSINIDKINEMFPNGMRIILREHADSKKVQDALPRAEVCQGSLHDKVFLTQCFEDVDTVVHIAGIHTSVKVTEAAVEAKVRRLILIHTTGIYSKYKAAGEEYRKIDSIVKELCNKNNIVYTICRPTMRYGNVYDGNVISFIKMVDKFPIMPVVNGAKYELQPVHYKDLAKAYYDVLINEEKTANREYNLSGGAPILLRDMLSVIGTNLGKKVHFISCPFVIAYIGAWFIFLISFGKIDYREKVQRLCEPRTFSYEKASNDFGYSPRTFEVGIVDEVNEYVIEKNA